MVPVIVARSPARSAWTTSSVSGGVSVCVGGTMVAFSIRAGARPPSAGMCRSFAAALFARCRFMVGDAAELPFTAGRFDIVLLSSLIHHLSDDQAGQLFDSLSRAMTPAAALLLSEPIWSRNPVSNLLLSCDRGKYVRQEGEYRRLISTRFHVESEFFFRYAATEFLGLVLRRRSQA